MGYRDQGLGRPRGRGTAVNARSCRWWPLEYLKKPNPFGRLSQWSLPQHPRLCSRRWSPRHQLGWDKLHALHIDSEHRVLRRRTWAKLGRGAASLGRLSLPRSTSPPRRARVRLLAVAASLNRPRLHRSESRLPHPRRCTSKRSSWEGRKRHSITHHKSHSAVRKIELQLRRRATLGLCTA